MNAKIELLNILKETNKIKCASIRLGDYEPKQFTLKLNYTPEEYETFIQSLNFNYDNGYGGQELYGIVWLEDNTWLSRHEYDGSEWWVHNILPIIPNECL